MPTLRLMADGRPIFATPGHTDADGIPSFAVGGGEVVRVDLDCTAFLGGVGTIDTATWTVFGCTVTSSSKTGTAATALVSVPSVSALTIATYGVAAIATLECAIATTDGRVQRTVMRLYVGSPRVALDGVADISVAS